MPLPLASLGAVIYGWLRLRRRTEAKLSEIMQADRDIRRAQLDAAREVDQAALSGLGFSFNEEYWLLWLRNLQNIAYRKSPATVGIIGAVIWISSHRWFLATWTAGLVLGGLGWLRSARATANKALLMASVLLLAKAQRGYLDLWNNLLGSPKNMAAWELRQASMALPELDPELFGSDRQNAMLTSAFRFHKNALEVLGSARPFILYLRNFDAGYKGIVEVVGACAARYRADILAIADPSLATWQILREGQHLPALLFPDDDQWRHAARVLIQRSTLIVVEADGSLGRGLRYEIEQIRLLGAEPRTIWLSPSDPDPTAPRWRRRWLREEDTAITQSIPHRVGGVDALVSWILDNTPGLLKPDDRDDQRIRTSRFKPQVRRSVALPWGGILMAFATYSVFC